MSFKKNEVKPNENLEAGEEKGLVVNNGRSIIAGYSKELADFVQRTKDAASLIGGDVSKRYADEAIEKLESAVIDLANAEAQDG